MKNKHRLPDGGCIDRDQPIRFKFNNKQYTGFQGDTLASALLANGVHMLARSLKYHRPRGILSAGHEEPNAIVKLCGHEDEPNAVATTVRLYEGLQAESLNCWPVLDHDIGVVNEILHRFIPAGFYYKTLMWPRNSWKYYSYFIRRAAGWGKAPVAFKSDQEERYEHRYYHCDVLVIGAGPAGIAAALASGRTGARVLWIDDQPQAGGLLLNYPAEIEGESASAWIRKIISEIDNMSNVIRLSNAIASGYYDHNLITVLETRPDKPWVRERLWKVRAKQVVLATGAIERPMVFANNDRPGIMLVNAVCVYLFRYGVLAGKDAVIYTNNNSAYEYVYYLAEKGLRIKAIIDIRDEISEDIKRETSQLGIKVHTGHYIKNVRGKKHVRSVIIAPEDEPNRIKELTCDLICTSGGWNPTIHLHSQSGGRPVYSQSSASFVPGDSVQEEISAGACNGTFSLHECLKEGISSGVAAVRKCGFDLREEITIHGISNYPLEIKALWDAPKEFESERVFLDFQNDVTDKDIRLAVRENYSSVELVKRYTTAGMGMDQGKTGNVNVIGLLSELTGKLPEQLGTTTYRPSYSPISFGSMAGANRGNLLVPLRQTPITPWFTGNGAYMVDTASGFQRPYYFPQKEENADQAVQREALAVRNGVGIYDSTPLGKVEINGPDALIFLNRVYTNSWDSLKEGHGKFGFMIHEDGRLLDDGVTFKLADDHYFMFTGSGAAESVYHHLEKLLACEWNDLKVYLTPVTDQWAAICVCGPLCRNVLNRVLMDTDFEHDDFPFMAMRSERIDGIDVRLLRVGYTGELSYEVHVSARHGLHIWNVLMEAGKEFNITPVGSDTSMLLRTEKGFIAAGLEGEGALNLYDVGMKWIINNKKGDFIGKRSLQRDLERGGDRQQVVGLEIKNEKHVPASGSPVLNYRAARDIDKIIGKVTSAYFSPNLHFTIALAQVKNGRALHGKFVKVSTKSGDLSAKIVDPIFIDPDGARMKG